MNVNEIGNRVYNGAAATGTAIINMGKQGVEWGGKAVTLIRENGSAGVQKVLRFIGSAWKAISSFFITHKDGLFTAVQNNRYALGLCGVLVAGIAIGALGAREYSRRYPTTEPALRPLVVVDESDVLVAAKTDHLKGATSVDGAGTILIDTGESKEEA